MAEQPEPPSLRSFGPHSAEDLHRKQILDEYERAGVDLPVVCLETVLDRERSANDFGGSPSRRSKLGSRFRSFSAGAVAGTSVQDAPVAGVPGEHGMRAVSPGTEEVFSTSAVHVAAAPDGYHGGYSVGSMKILGEVPASQIYDDDLFPPTAETSPSRNKSFAGAVNVEESKEEEATPSSRNPQDSNTSFSQAAATAAAEEGPTPGESITFQCGQCCCPNKNEVESDQKYVVSNLQTAEAFDDGDNSGRFRYDMIYGQNSLLDMEDTVTTASTMEKYQDEEIPPKHKRSLFQGNTKFSRAMAACCILHIVMVGLIIGFAIHDRDDSESPTATSTSFGSAQMDGPDDEDVAVQSGSTTTCIDAVDLGMRCYGLESEILVYFLSCDPQPGDWVAIYESSVDATTLPQDTSLDWLFTCGDQVCSDAVSSEVVAFSQAFMKVGGTYKAHLIRDGPGPVFAAYASSVEFRVEESDADCDVM